MQKEEPGKRKAKTGRQMERYFKGVANHRRIDILFLVQSAEGITLDEIAERLGGNFKTISEHTRRLVQAGLLNKTYCGRAVEHSLSPYGRRMITCLKTFQYS